MYVVKWESSIIDLQIWDNDDYPDPQVNNARLPFDHRHSTSG